ncbi:MAG TPA: hypothetical protein VGE62_01850, partial [Candidatus Paceibacterota bacterium]
QMRADGKQPRADDKPELIADRLDTYFQHQPEIMSGAALFADVIDIDASKEVAEVTEDIIKAISDSPASSID